MRQKTDYNQNAGYIAERAVTGNVGGHMVVYDRNRGFDCDADTRWIVCHEPSGYHIAVSTRSQAFDVMRDGVTDPAAVLGIEDSDILDSLALHDKHRE